MVNHAHPCAYLEIRQCIPAHHYQVGPMVQPDYLRAAKQALRLVPIELVFRSNAAHMWSETTKKKTRSRLGASEGGCWLEREVLIVHIYDGRGIGINVPDPPNDCTEHTLVRA